VAKGCITGKMVIDMKVIGIMIKDKERGFLWKRKQVINIMVIGKTIIILVMERLRIMQMGNTAQGTGCTPRCMGKVVATPRKGRSCKKEFGNLVNFKNDLKLNLKLILNY